MLSLDLEFSYQTSDDKELFLRVGKECGIDVSDKGPSEGVLVPNVGDRWRYRENLV